MNPTLIAALMTNVCPCVPAAATANNDTSNTVDSDAYRRTADCRGLSVTIKAISLAATWPDWSSVERLPDRPWLTAKYENNKNNKPSFIALLLWLLFPPKKKLKYVFLNRLQEHLYTSDNQSGFKRGHSILILKELTLTFLSWSCIAF